jgi:hypothetical protein
MAQNPSARDRAYCAVPVEKTRSSECGVDSLSGISMMCALLLAYFGFDKKLEQG